MFRKTLIFFSFGFQFKGVFKKKKLKNNNKTFRHSIRKSENIHINLKGLTIKLCKRTQNIKKENKWIFQTQRIQSV